MAAAAVSAAGLDDARMKLLCSHGGRLAAPRGGALRYVGGETRVLVVPRAATFRDLAARAAEVAGGAEVRAIRHRLADGDGEGLEDVLVSVTCDEELAHMRDEYDRLLATRPGARFRVFVTTAAISASSGGGGVYQQRAKAGLPPLAPAMRRVQSERAVLHRRRLAYPAPVRRVQSAQEFAGGIHAQQPFFHHHRHQQCCCSCRHCRDLCAPAPPPARPMNAVPYMPKKATPAAPMPAAKAPRRVVFTDAAREMARSRETLAAIVEKKAIWEFE